MPHVWLFLLTSIAITVMPGPDNLQVIARGASQGRKAGLTAAAGAWYANCHQHPPHRGPRQLNAFPLRKQLRQGVYGSYCRSAPGQEL